MGSRTLETMTTEVEQHSIAAPRMATDQRGDMVPADEGGALLAQRISRALLQAATAARHERSITGGRGGFGAREGNRQFKRFLLGIWIAVFAIPSVLSILYFAFVAADQYQVESRFAVRATKSQIGDLITSVTGASAGASKAETAIVAKYITSEAMARDLDQRVALSDRYASPQADYLSRFDPSEPIEDLLSYWKWKVDVSEESSTGIITVKVRAFTPADVMAISNAVLERMVSLVNGLSEQNRRSLLEVAEQRLERARQKLLGIVQQMAGLRDASGVLDGDQQGQAQLKLVTQLELSLSKLIATRESFSSLASESVKMRTLLRQIKSLEKEIARQRAKLTNVGSAAAGGALSGVLSDFETLRVEQQIARNEYVTAAASFEDARIAAMREEMYLSVFMRPTEPESATYPRRFLYSLIAVALAAFVSFALVTIAKAVRDNRA